MKNIKIDEIYSIKLSSGEEVVAKITRADDTTVDLSDPVSVAPGPQGMGLMPSMFTADPGLQITLNTSTITMYCETADPVKMKYIEATTGIKVPSKKIVLG